MLVSAIVFCILLVHQASSSTQYQEMWAAWKLQNKKNYTEEQEKNRYAIFLENINRIEKFNNQNSTVKLGLNKFSDLSKEEFKNIYTNGTKIKKHDNSHNKNFLKSSLDINLPEKVDWRESGVLGEPKDQGPCGSCWTFSTVGALEAYYSLRLGSLISFSEQQILDCCGSPNEGCNGGYPYLALEYASINGLELETDYPYKASEGICKYNAEKATLVNIGYAFPPPKSKDSLKAAIALTPTVVVVQANPDIWHSYTSGVVSVGCGPDVDHAVLAVGYTKIDGVEAFIVRNSWGTDWGNKGYIYISTDSSLNNGMGACGIFTQPLIPF